MNEDALNELIEHLNNFQPGDTEDLGDVLFGDVDVFKSKMSQMQTEEKRAFFDELKAQKVIDDDAGAYKYDDD